MSVRPAVASWERGRRKPHARPGSGSAILRPEGVGESFRYGTRIVAAGQKPVLPHGFCCAIGWSTASMEALWPVLRLVAEWLSGSHGDFPARRIPGGPGPVLRGPALGSVGSRPARSRDRFHSGVNMASLRVARFRCCANGRSSGKFSWRSLAQSLLSRLHLVTGRSPRALLSGIRPLCLYSGSPA